MTQLVDFPARSAGRALIVLQGTESGVLASFSDWLALAAAVSGVIGTISSSSPAMLEIRRRGKRPWTLLLPGTARYGVYSALALPSSASALCCKQHWCFWSEWA